MFQNLQVKDTACNAPDQHDIAGQSRFEGLALCANTEDQTITVGLEKYKDTYSLTIE